MEIFPPFRGVSYAPTIPSRLTVVLGTTALIAACASQPIAETSKTNAATARHLASSEPGVVCRDVTVNGERQVACHTRKEWSQIEYTAFVNAQRSTLPFPSPNGSSPSSNVGVQPWAPQMPVPSVPVH